jgi:nitrogen fixation protein FixH
LKTDSELTDAEKQRLEDIRRGRPVPYVIVGFYMSFMLMFFAFVYIAFRYPPSETTSEAYQKGLQYNQILAENERGNALGWKVDAEFQKGILTCYLLDSKGEPIRDAVVKAWFVHPSDSKRDKSFDLKVSKEGLYSIKTEGIEVAHWQIHITAAKGDNEVQTEIEAEVE